MSLDIFSIMSQSCKYINVNEYSSTFDSLNRMFDHDSVIIWNNL